VNLGALEIGLIVLAILLLFGYKKLPDASRSLGRSLRIFKGEMKGMQDDARSSAAAPVPSGEIPATPAATGPSHGAAQPHEEGQSSV
jgi:sec-independent protein translocase protein TatA